MNCPEGLVLSSECGVMSLISRFMVVYSKTDSGLQLLMMVVPMPDMLRCLGIFGPQ
jgi:hypothetical protein